MPATKKLAGMARSYGGSCFGLAIFMKHHKRKKDIHCAAS